MVKMTIHLEIAESEKLYEQVMVILCKFKHME
jgi:hypothetical protein